nr:immunoglobulin heavy chain junction region [Macaca mulatta]
CVRWSRGYFLDYW